MFIGGDAPVSIQSMTNTDTRDVEKTVQQILKLQESGCELVRVAVPDMEAAQALKQIKERISLPLIADIHFNYKYALKAIENGVDKVRINPGNIGSRNRVKEVARAAGEYGVPIRIGVTAGSLDKKLLEKYGGPTAEALVESALSQAGMLEDFNFDDIIISLKAADVLKMIKAYELISEKTSYPLHLGVTEAGTAIRSAVKSGVGIGNLLMKGIGDTIRVSITGNPLTEILVAREILRSVGFREIGPEIISCPTCGRCEIDLISLTERVEKQLETFPYPLKVAIMGCVVNGPGEAREADIGIAGGRAAGV
ncbi:MAG: flavodoxin-dependent (E)-4-hydroxy-3-methylbut-2-enyl-diphosphate synthase, partial [Candidatus Contubernalis sp.]|nr:flavodoxin-dependent (E)-4-hydroxy-3-methylbut-2-enyl-diphosphate synthase [Candidatus Contubernalis sp.]